MGFTMVNSSIEGGRGTSMRLGPAGGGGVAAAAPPSSGRALAAGSTVPMSRVGPGAPRRFKAAPAPPRGVTGQRVSAGEEGGALARPLAQRPLRPHVGARNGGRSGGAVSSASQPRLPVRQAAGGPAAGSPPAHASGQRRGDSCACCEARLPPPLATPRLPFCAGLCVAAAAAVMFALRSRPCGAAPGGVW